MIESGLYVYPRKTKAPIALLTDGLKPWDDVSWQGQFFAAVYIADAFGGLAYIFTRGGSAFIEKEKLILRKPTY